MPTISPPAAVTSAEAETELLLAQPAISEPANRRLLGRLARERDHLYTFFEAPGIDATNWRAEQALRAQSSTASCGAATAPRPAPAPKSA
jgi:hypothetical protein